MFVSGARAFGDGNSRRAACPFDLSLYSIQVSSDLHTITLTYVSDIHAVGLIELCDGGTTVRLFE